MGTETLDYKLGTIDTKLDQILAALPNVDRRQGALERRVGVLENARWKLVGIVTGASAVISMLLAIFFKK